MGGNLCREVLSINKTAILEFKCRVAVKIFQIISGKYKVWKGESMLHCYIKKLQAWKQKITKWTNGLYEGEYIFNVLIFSLSRKQCIN